MLLGQGWPLSGFGAGVVMVDSARYREGLPWIDAIF